MDFFEHQDAARRKTGRLVVLFVVAVIAIITMVYFVVAGAIVMSRGYQHNRSAQRQQQQPPGLDDLWNPQLLLGVGLGTLAVVGFASAYKISQLSAGGHVVAESMQGRLLNPNTNDLNEKKLLNVVQEMAIASGMSTPPVYLIDEPGINAFAAGFSPDDAVIGITRGAMEMLSRDQLQGVIAHEFSHILNGDMRLNIRLMGTVFGILAIGLIGQMLFRAALYSGAGRRRSSNDRNNPIPLIAIGLALVVVGYLGVFFANIIKAAVSRQREFLADASAVQFTRNPDGIGGALKAIGGWVDGSHLNSPNAAEVSHMLFGQGFTSHLGSLTATHPPLAERIRRIDPSFDGKFPEVHSPGAAERAQALQSESARGFAGGNAPARAMAPVAASAIAQIGQPSAAHVAYAAKVLGDIPSNLKQAVDDPFGAQAVVFALLINDDAQIQAKQFERLTQFADQPTLKHTRQLLPIVARLNETAHLPLIDLAIPSLRTMSPSQHRVFQENVQHLIQADQRIDLFEWVLQRILTRHVSSHFDAPSRRSAQYYSLKPVMDSVSRLLSTLAYAGQSDDAEARKAFDAAASQLGNMSSLAKFFGRDVAKLQTLDAALDELNNASPREKKKLLQACAACIAADRKITPREAELFRAIADALGCPVPPILPGQPLAA